MIVIFLQRTSEKYPDGISKTIIPIEKTACRIKISCIENPLSLKNKDIIGIETKNHLTAFIT
jgi:hypothetical protein